MRLTKPGPFTLGTLVALFAILAALAPSASTASARARSALSPTPGASSFGYQNYGAPLTAPYSNTAGEPSIGDNFNTGNVLYQSSLATVRVTFSDKGTPTTTTPPTAVFTDVSNLSTSATSLDEGLFTDHTTGRTYVTQLGGATSFAAFTDDDGATQPFTQGVIPPTNDVDHETIGGGPFATGATIPITTLPTTSYPHALYYCSQGIADAGCELSRDGGLTFGPTMKMYASDLTSVVSGVPAPGTCGGLHGHVKVAPDGTVYVPNKGCEDANGVLRQGLAVSTDNGTTWSVRTISGTTASGVPFSSTNSIWDPSVGLGANNTVYFGYRDGDGTAHIAVSHDRGQTWVNDTNVGAPFNIARSAFPAVVAGDDDRASYAFLGTPSNVGGADSDGAPGFVGVWHLYIATTTDGGQTWSTVDATPNNPVQRGAICSGGTSCTANSGDNTRNLLDFMDATVDKYGRVLVGYDDGCIDACDQGGDAGTNPNSFTAYATIARQTAGPRLFAQYDPQGTGAGGGVPPTATPEPGSGALYGTGLVAVLATVALWRRRVRRAPRS